MISARLTLLDTIATLSMDDGTSLCARLLAFLNREGHPHTSDVRMITARAQEAGGMLAEWLQAWQPLVKEALKEEWR